MPDARPGRAFGETRAERVPPRFGWHRLREHRDSSATMSKLHLNQLLLSVLASLACSISFAQVRVGVDARSNGGLSFFQINMSTNDAVITTVKSDARSRLKTPHTALYYFGSGPETGQWLRADANQRGLLQRFTAFDGSRVDLRWNKPSGYRQATVILRDSRGRKVSYAENLALAMDLSSATDAVIEQGKSPPSYVDFYRVLGKTREELLNEPFIGEPLVGLFDSCNRCVETLVDQISSIPDLTNKAESLGLKVAKLFGKTVASAADLSGKAQEYAGNLSKDLAVRGRASIQKMLESVEGADFAIGVLKNRPVEGSYSGTLPSVGHARIDQPPAVVREGENFNLTVVREGGGSGILSGRIVVSAISPAGAADISFRYSEVYMFLDGDTKPKTIRLKALRDRFAEGDETLILEHDGGGENFEQFSIVVKEAPPRARDFKLRAVTGGARSLGNASGCGESGPFEMNGAVHIYLDYDSGTNEALARITGSGGTYLGDFFYEWEGPVSWDGVSFTGQLSRTENPARPSATIQITQLPSGAFSADVTVPFTHRFYKLDGSCTGPLQTFTFSANGVRMISY